jgi:hypothetical protein
VGDHIDDLLETIEEVRNKVDCRNYDLSDFDKLDDKIATFVREEGLELKMRIPLEECKHGGLYRISSRNLSLGVYDERHHGFTGIREKFGEFFLDTEFHWDTGAPFGTAHPKELLEMVPEEIGVDHSVEVEYTEEVKKEHGIVSTSVEMGDLIRVQNDALFKWLEGKQEE